MKIALVILNAEPQRGGAERYTQDLATALVARGHEVHLLATRFARSVEPARQVHLDGVAGSRIARYRALAKSLARHLQSHAYDLVHAMLPVPGCDLYHPHAGIEAENLESGHLRHRGKVRQAISKLSSQLNRKRRLYASTERRMLEQGSALLCLSNAMQRVALKHYQLAERQSYALINGVDLGRYDPAHRHDARSRIRRQYSIAANDVVALLMSNNYRLKGLRQAIQALQRLAEARRENARLMVVGRESVEPYRKLARRLGVADRVIFAGPTDDPPAIYAAADLFVLPTAYDSCSLVVLEALAMGLPVVTTRANGASEAMQDGVHGFIIENQADQDGLCKAWDALLNDALRMNMHTAALGLRTELSQERHVDRLLEIYQAVVGRKRNGGASLGETTAAARHPRA
jgi:UDP-glucose:(heptosyl)LPS alpha-1,3-glucosyltransferase